MKLFDKYLLACTNQRIPMPNVWQESLGLTLTNSQQGITNGSGSVENTGYKFQQDETLQRGFISYSPKAFAIEQKETYVVQMYLQALFEHKGEDYRHYFSLSTTVTYEHPYYITVAPIVMGESYSVYGSTLLPTTIEVYNQATNKVLYTKIVDSMSLLSQVLIVTTQQTYPDVKGTEEYIVLRVSSYAKVNIVQGVHNRLPLSRIKNFETYKENTITPPVYEQSTITAKTAATDSKTTPNQYFPVSLPITGYTKNPYADKLISSLLGIQITKNSPPEERRLLPTTLAGDTPEEKIMLNTPGLYDVDQYIGGKLVW